MRRILYIATVLTLALRCATAPPPPPPAAEPAPAPAPVEEKVVGTATVNASALNVRAEANTEAAVVTQVKRGAKVSILSPGESWTKIRLAGGETGFVSSRFLKREGERATTKGRSRKSCPADSDFAFVETPTLTFSDSGAHGLVVVDATVNTQGDVVSTKVISNDTGDEALAFLTEREIKSAKFAPPIRDCVPRTFIFTYRRTF